MLPVPLHTSTVAVSSCLLKGMDLTKEVSEFKEQKGKFSYTALQQ